MFFFLLCIQAAVTREFSEDKIRSISDKLREVSSKFELKKKKNESFHPS